jgi:hypothetical protein
MGLSIHAGKRHGDDIDIDACTDTDTLASTAANADSFASTVTNTDHFASAVTDADVYTRTCPCIRFGANSPDNRDNHFVRSANFDRKCIRRELLRLPIYIRRDFEANKYGVLPAK